MAIDGDYVLVGAPQDAGEDEVRVGSLSRYGFVDGAWAFVDRLFPEGLDGGAQFGGDLAPRVW